MGYYKICMDNNDEHITHIKIFIVWEASKVLIITLQAQVFWKLYVNGERKNGTKMWEKLEFIVKKTREGNEKSKYQYFGSMALTNDTWKRKMKGISRMNVSIKANFNTDLPLNQLCDLKFELYQLSSWSTLSPYCSALTVGLCGILEQAGCRDWRPPPCIVQ